MKLTEYGHLQRVLVKHARDAFGSTEQIARQWKQLNYTAPPDFSKAIEEYDRFLEHLSASGAALVTLPCDPTTNLDSIYTRDASVLSPAGVVFCRMGKVTRADEPLAQRDVLGQAGALIAGGITSPGSLEGGDLLWLDERTVAVGRGKRTNAEGIHQFEDVLGDWAGELIVVPLPDDPGPHDVMHLMSFVSPVDRDLAVVFSPLLPDAFRAFLLDRGYRLIEVPPDEYDTMGTNVLALGPRDCLMVEGNPRTRAALERAGARVRVYDGVEISLKGGGGPTCLTRPLARS
jgi:N-dimethylarginine dimethylaminohydrolase